MRHLLRFIPSLGLIFSLIIPLGASAGVNDFTFTSFTGDYYLSSDSTSVSHLRVRERLEAQFPSEDQNHGILRAIPKSYDNHPVNLTLFSVTGGDGEKLPYSTSTSNDNLVLKIGDAHSFVHGRQIYNIEYTADNVTSATGNLFAWDINGDQWPQTFGSVTAHIHLAPGLKLAPYSDPRCFTGGTGSTNSQCTSLPGGTPNDIGFTTTHGLAAYETMTVNLDFTPGTFAAYSFSKADALYIARSSLVPFGLPILITLVLLALLWRQFGRDPRGRGVIIPEYLPLSDMTVIMSGALWFEEFKPKTITAQIIDLAVRHYLKIYEIKTKVLLIDKTDYEIELVQEPSGLRPDELDVIALLFGDNPPVGARIKLSELAAWTEAKDIGKRASQQVTQLGYWRGNPVSVAAPYYFAGVVVMVAAYTIRGADILLNISLFICAVLIIVARRFMSARTAEGVRRREYLLGLKLYMEVAEAERLRILQSPNGDLTEKIDVNDHSQLIKIYERLLPYAILFGIEKDWARQFAGLYLEPPTWYISPIAFNPDMFSDSMADFTAGSTAFNPPSSGGGGAGGGGGGGGGGGW